MKTDELSLRVEVGQYWVDRYTLEIQRVSRVEENKVHFESGAFFVRPIGNRFTLLWHTTTIYRSYFRYSNVVPGQVWVSNQSQEVFFIHPSQEGVDTVTGVRVLSDSSRINGPCSLVQNVPV